MSGFNTAVCAAFHTTQMDMWAATLHYISKLKYDHILLIRGNIIEANTAII